jgi:thioredoxin-related protein
MKKLLTILAFTLMSSAMAQNWLTDFPKAKEIAAKENKQIVMVFQGSDWCAPCIKLDREIWSTDVFVNYANENFVLLQVDFPRRKKNTLSKTQTVSNAQLAERYNTRGVFPFVVVLNAKGEVLGETGYKKMSPENYIEELNTFSK